MNNDGVLRYKQLMSRSIVPLDHFKTKYKQRVSKRSEKTLETVRSAYLFGEDIDSIEDDDLRSYLQQRAEVHGGTGKIYRGFVYWFIQNRAITVYPVPVMKKRSNYEEL